MRWLLIVAMCARVAHAGSGNGFVVESTFIHSRFPNNNDGGCTFLTVGRDGSAGLMRGVLKFSLPNPAITMAGRTVVSQVTITLTTRALPGGNPGTADSYMLRRVTTAWSQGGGCGLQMMGSYHVGVPCTAGNSASWNSPDCSVSSWGTGGSAITNTSTVGATVTWDTACSGVLGSLCDAVQSWIDNGNAFGFQLTNTETTNGVAQSFLKSGTLAFTYSCKAGFLDTGSTCTSCTSAANSACQSSVPGNGCIDNNIAGSTAYHCSCNAAGWHPGSGQQTCVPGCTATTCTSAGDAGASCADTSNGFTCTCDAGFIFNGITCVSTCGHGPDPCGAGGTCTVNGGGWTCACTGGYVSTGGSQPSCVDFNACTSGTGQTDCATAQSGNTCTDQPPPSATYQCTCGHAGYIAGTALDGNPGCVDNNECAPNPCDDGGDVAAICTDHVIPASGYDCACDTGFTSNTTTCVNNCTLGPDPCGNGGTCSVAGAGWTCTCPTGYASAGGAHPACIDLDACDAAAIAACTTQPGNACVDELAPSTHYHCTCGNPAYSLGTIGGFAACVDTNECATNHCVDGGDSTATCADHAAPATGYDCTCDAGWMSDGATCADVNECGAAPCGDHGACTNMPGTYECQCEAGYETTLDAAPTCVAVPVPASSGCGCASDGAPSPLPLAIMLLPWLRRRRRA